MARPVEYDLEQVLDSAMELFWQKGYENVSMAQLVSHTGLNRRTMYSLFKDKDGLYHDALDNYYTKRACNVISVLKSNPGKSGIEIFLKKFTFHDDFKGCLLSNCMRDVDFMNKNAFDIPKEYFDNLGLQIEENLNQASINGDFSGDAKAMALTIITIIHGFNVHGKYNHSKEDGKLIIENLLEMIR